MPNSYRRFHPSDIPALVKLINAIHQHEGKPGGADAERIQHMAAAPHLHAEENFTVALGTGRSLIGAGIFMLRPNSGMAFGDVIVHPDYRTSEIPLELLWLTEERVLLRAKYEVPPDEPVTLGFGIEADKGYLREVLKAHGYRDMGGQYVMQITLDTPLSLPDFPPEFTLRPFEAARDGQAVHAVFQECFAGHRGGVANVPYEQWSHQFNAPDFDPTLWDVLYHDTAIAAICLGETKDASTGVVEVLGVRPAYRQRGLGGMLLRHAFYRFQQRGFTSVILDVDTENTSNAVALYENAGMRVLSYVAHYAKILRAP